jgi:hypothetical protein
MIPPERAAQEKGTKALSKQAADTIVGLFLTLDSADHEHYRTGEIIAAVGNCYLIQFDKGEELVMPQPPAELYTLEELSGSCEKCGQKRANLFKSRADLEQWIDWVNKPEKPEGPSGKVVHLKKPH